jgi:predicted dehydrogenase
MPLQEPGSINWFRVALIGPGTHAKRDIIPALLLQRDAKLVLVASRSLEHARQAALEFGGIPYTDCWSEVINCDHVDAVIATASPALHADVIRECLLAGIPVFVDKPPARDLATLKRLASLENRTGGVVFVGYNFAFSASYQDFLHRLTRQSQIVCFKVQFVSSQPKCPGRYGSIAEAILLETGSHAVDLAIRCLGPSSGVSAKLVDLSADRHLVALTVEHQGGLCSMIEIGNYSPRFELNIAAICKDGSQGSLRQLGAQRIWINRGDSNSEHSFETFEWPPRLGGYIRAGYQVELMEFMSAVKKRDRSASSVSHSVAVYEVLDAALRQVESRSLGDSAEARV